MIILFTQILLQIGVLYFIPTRLSLATVKGCNSGGISLTWFTTRCTSSRSYRSREKSYSRKVSSQYTDAVKLATSPSRLYCVLSKHHVTGVLSGTVPCFDSPSFLTERIFRTLHTRMTGPTWLRTVRETRTIIRVLSGLTLYVATEVGSSNKFYPKTEVLYSRNRTHSTWHFIDWT